MLSESRSGWVGWPWPGALLPPGKFSAAGFWRQVEAVVAASLATLQLPLRPGLPRGPGGTPAPQPLAWHGSFGLWSVLSVLIFVFVSAGIEVRCTINRTAPVKLVGP